MNAMLTKYLKDFSAPQPIRPVGGDILESLSGSPLASMDFGPDPEPPVDIEAERREAHEEGYSEAEAFFEQKHATELASLREAHAKELQAMAETHENDTIWMIHTRFHEMTQVISQTVAEQTLQVLLPVFEEDVTRRAVERLAEVVRETLLESGISTVVVRGPERLYERLKALLENQGIESRFIESASVDISVEINETVLTTRLATWAQSLSEVTG